MTGAAEAGGASVIQRVHSVVCGEMMTAAIDLQVSELGGAVVSVMCCGLHEVCG